MKNTITYKDYVGSVEFSEEDMCFCGKLLGIKPLIMYEGNTAEELIRDFHEAVDSYCELCRQEGKVPEVPYKGNTNVRLKPATHKRAAIYAYNHQMTLNNLIEESVSLYLATNI